LGDKSNDPTKIEKTKNKLAFENERGFILVWTLGDI